MKRKLIFLEIALIVLLAVFIFLFISSMNKAPKNEPIIGDKNVETEINRLLLPVSNQSITEKDFDNLAEMVKNDEYASGEVVELSTLAKDKEYTHIGHGLAFLYEYVQTGKEPICPGHLLAHYYVFEKHGDDELAHHNYHESKDSLPIWEGMKDVKSEAYLTQIKYTYFDNLFNSKIKSIDAGNTSATEAEISELASAPCLRWKESIFKICMLFLTNVKER